MLSKRASSIDYSYIATGVAHTLGKPRAETISSVRAAASQSCTRTSKAQYLKSHYQPTAKMMKGLGEALSAVKLTAGMGPSPAETVTSPEFDDEYRRFANTQDWTDTVWPICDTVCTR